MKIIRPARAHIVGSHIHFALTNTNQLPEIALLDAARTVEIRSTDPMIILCHRMGKWRPSDAVDVLSLRWILFGALQDRFPFGETRIL